MRVMAKRPSNLKNFKLFTKDKLLKCQWEDSKSWSAIVKEIWMPINIFSVIIENRTKKKV